MIRKTKNKRSILNKIGFSTFKMINESWDLLPIMVKK